MSGLLGTISAGYGLYSGASNLLDNIFGGDGPVTLGSVTFDGHEVPATIRWGGAQSLAVHKLPGGARVVDAMGRDDAQIEWTGRFYSQDAQDRAFQVDAMRVAGAVVPLVFGSHYLNVVIQDFAPSDTYPTMIPYRISCVVVKDMSQSSGGGILSAISAVYQDVNEAIGYVSGIVGAFQSSTALAAASTAVSAAAPSGLTLGASTSLAAIAAIRAAYAACEVDQQAADAEIEAQALTALATSLVGSTAALAAAATQAGISAQMSAAQGYIGRAVKNAQNGAT